MRILSDCKEFLPVLSGTNLLINIPEDHYPSVFRYLKASIRRYEKEEFIQRLGEPLLYSGIVLDGLIEGSFINENYNKINMNHFSAGSSFAEALACMQTPHSPIQLKALTDCTVILFDLHQILSDSDCPCTHQQTLSKNLIRILANQNVFSNLKLRIVSQKALRDRILMYLSSLAPDSEGWLHIPFSQTALAEFLGVNRSAMSRELGHMQDEGLLSVDGRSIKLTLAASSSQP
ncbi:MAG: Crp/Fnr family transcriptional regulator [Eubacteriales bacterium]|nr:Crp/Fnr family transcriptional regulator [Eubacteriales bacterium]